MENKQISKNNRVVIISSECFNRLIWSLFVFTLFAIILIPPLILYVIVFFATFPASGNDWTLPVSMFLLGTVFIVGLFWLSCHIYKLSKIIFEDDEIIFNYSFTFIRFIIYFGLFRIAPRLTPEEKKYEKRRYIEEKGKKKFFRFSLISKYHLKCSEIIEYESLAYKSIRTNKLEVSGFVTLYPVNKKTGKKTTKHVYRKIPIMDARYTKMQMFYILTRIKENGGLQGDAYDDAIKQVSITHK